MPIKVKETPVVKKMEAIKLAQPETVKPPVRTPNTITIPPMNDITDIRIPTEVAIFRGRTENATMMSIANLSLFRNVYEGLPENLVP